MTARPFLRSLLAALMAASWLTGCRPAHNDARQPDHDHGHEHEHEQGQSPDADHATKSPAGAPGAHGAGDPDEHDVSPSSSAWFKAGLGVGLTEETRRSIGVILTEAALRPLRGEIPLSIQVYGEKHRHLLNPQDHAGCDVHGSGFLSTNTAAAVRVGLPVHVRPGTSNALDGVVLAVQAALALGESEIVVGVSNAIATLAPGEFVPARILLPAKDPVVAIPNSALLRSAEGPFVYVARGDAYRRTAVEVGAEVDGWAEIPKGLSPGDRVVTQPVQTLWLIELRATKGGGHSH